MSDRFIYKITVLNWERHNPKHKQYYKKALIDNNFGRDAKLRILPMTTRWLFLNIVLSCSDICRDTVELSPNTLRGMLECNRSIVGALRSLQSLQLLTFEKVDPLRVELNRIELNRIEETREKKQIEMPIKKAPSVPPRKLGHEAVKFYCDEWKKRYGGNPDIRAQDGKNLKRLVDEFGINRTREIIRAFLAAPDPWFIKKRHDITTMIGSLTQIKHFETSGKVVTSQVIKDAEEKINDAQGTVGGPRHISELIAEREAQRENLGGVRSDNTAAISTSGRKATGDLE